MATLNAEHINPFLIAAKKVIQDMCFVDVSIQKPGLKEADFGSDTWVIIIGVTGEMRGQVLLAMMEKDACTMLGNLIMGTAATVFSSSGVGIDITPPALSHGKVSFTSTYAKSLCVPLTFDGSIVELYLALRQE